MGGGGGGRDVRAGHGEAPPAPGGGPGRSGPAPPTRARPAAGPRGGEGGGGDVRAGHREAGGGAERREEEQKALEGLAVTFAAALSEMWLDSARRWHAGGRGRCGSASGASSTATVTSTTSHSWPSCVPSLAWVAALGDAGGDGEQHTGQASVAASQLAVPADPVWAGPEHMGRVERER